MSSSNQDPRYIRNNRLNQNMNVNMNPNMNANMIPNMNANMNSLTDNISNMSIYEDMSPQEYARKKNELAANKQAALRQQKLRGLDKNQRQTQAQAKSRAQELRNIREDTSVHEILKQEIMIKDERILDDTGYKLQANVLDAKGDMKDIGISDKYFYIDSNNKVLTSRTTDGKLVFFLNKLESLEPVENIIEMEITPFYFEKYPTGDENISFFSPPNISTLYGRTITMLIEEVKAQAIVAEDNIRFHFVLQVNDEIEVPTPSAGGTPILVGEANYSNTRFYLTPLIGKFIFTKPVQTLNQMTLQFRDPLGVIPLSPDIIEGCFQSGRVSSLYVYEMATQFLASDIPLLIAAIDVAIPPPTSGPASYLTSTVLSVTIDGVFLNITMVYILTAPEQAALDAVVGGFGVIVTFPPAGGDPAFPFVDGGLLGNAVNAGGDNAIFWIRSLNSLSKDFIINEYYTIRFYTAEDITILDTYKDPTLAYLYRTEGHIVQFKIANSKLTPPLIQPLPPFPSPFPLDPFQQYGYFLFSNFAVPINQGTSFIAFTPIPSNICYDAQLSVECRRIKFGIRLRTLKNSFTNQIYPN